MVGNYRQWHSTYDDSVYPNADTYEPFRFSDLPNIAEADKSTGKGDRVLKKHNDGEHQ